ncbi:MAG: 4-azaleucine resistance transporter AzlC [Oleispira sp.]|jgi:4-azaleucine resistance transporter AzlC
MSSKISQHSNTRAWLAGALAVMPLSIAVIPWGILAGSLALDAGLSILESQAMSAIVFAGAAQLVAVGMIKAGMGLTSILITTLLITSRHFLYSMAMRNQISPLPLKWRLSLGFLLTDELFAIIAKSKGPHVYNGQLNRWYALGGGLSFYLTWNIASAVGIFVGNSIPDLENWGLDFAIAATFIALVIPAIKSPSILVCVLVSLVTSIVCELFEIPSGLLIASLLGMAVGTFYAKAVGEKQGESQ